MKHHIVRREDAISLMALVITPLCLAMLDCVIYIGICAGEARSQSLEITVSPFNHPYLATIMFLLWAVIVAIVVACNFDIEEKPVETKQPPEPTSFKEE
jgi:hypothetical protein